MQDVAAYLSGRSSSRADSAIGTAPKAVPDLRRVSRQRRHRHPARSIRTSRASMRITSSNALHGYKSGQRKNAVMAGMTAALTPQDINDLANYYSSQRPSLCATDGITKQRSAPGPERTESVHRVRYQQPRPPVPRLHDATPNHRCQRRRRCPGPGQRGLPDRYRVRAAGTRRQPPGRRQRSRRVRRYRAGSRRTQAARTRSTKLGIAREQVDYVFLTHVHLDHAGGAGQLMQALPNARAVLHPRGAPHMVDPSKLIAGSIEVYGEAMYRQAVRRDCCPCRPNGSCSTRRRHRARSSAPAPSSSSIRPVMRGITIARSTSITATSSAATPSASRYRDFDTAAGPFMFPTTTPVQFDPDALHASIDRLLSYRPQRIVLTHFGPVADLERLGARPARRTSTSSCASRAGTPSAADRTARIAADMFDYFDAAARRARLYGRQARRHELLDDDMRLNTQGLDVWLTRQVTAAFQHPRRARANLPMSTFRAYRIHRIDGRITPRFDQIGLDDLDSRRGRRARVVLRHQLQGRAGCDRHLADPAPVSARRRHRPRGRSREFDRRALHAGPEGARDRQRSQRDARRRLCGVRAACTGDWVITLPPGMYELRRDDARHRRLHGGARRSIAWSRTASHRPRARSSSPVPPVASAASRSTCWRVAVTRSSAVSGKPEADAYLRELGAARSCAARRSTSVRDRSRSRALGRRGRQRGRRAAHLAHADDGFLGQHREHRPRRQPRTRTRRSCRSSCVA